MGERRRFWAAFLRGMGSVLDRGGMLGPRLLREALTAEAVARADREAILAAWQAVGDALREAISTFEDEVGGLR